MASGRELAVLICFMVVAHAQTKFTTYGSSGEMCGEHRCLMDSKCVKGKCVCPDYAPAGNGAFVCLSPNHDICTFKNDPVLDSFDGSKVEVPIMNKVLLSHVETHGCDTGHGGLNLLRRGDTECDVRIFTYGHRKLGKMFVQGLEVKIMATRGGRVYNHAVRLNAGMDGEGHHTFVEEGNDGFLGSGPYRNPLITKLSSGHSIKTRYNREDNFAVIDVPECGVVAGLRGLDFSGKYDFHVQEPGVYVAVDRTCEPQFTSVQKTLCAGPVGSGNTLEDQQTRMERDTGRQVSPHTMMMIKALNSDPFPDFKTSARASKMLYNLAETSLECDAPLLVDAVNNCTFIFSRAKFHKCYDSEEDDAKAITLYNNCLFSICDYNHGMCTQVQESIRESKCHPSSPSIMDHSCKFEDK